MGIPVNSPDLQHQILAPTSYPMVVQSQAYRTPESIPHVFAGATISNPQEVQNIVWIQAPNLVTHDENDTNPVILAQPFPSGSLSVQNSHQGVIPVLMNVNGQRLLVNHPVHHVAATPPAFCQLATDQQSNEGVHVVNFNNVNHTAQNLASLPQDFRPTISISSLQDNQVPAYSRPRLTPKRRNGNVISTCDAAASWRNINDDRFLSRINTAQRRRSQSTDEGNHEAFNTNVSGSPSPNKRLASITTSLEHNTSIWRSSDSRLLRKLVDIIEYYFSDECLSKNGYMLKQLNNGDGDGYISIRRVAALKRVKAQTRDLQTVAHAVTQSAKLELDKDGLMIRRKRPLPENMEAPRFIRSVLAINLPTEAPTVEDVTSLFKPYGELTQVRVLRPGKALPSYLRDYTAWVADLGTRVCAVIEFENQEEAQKACREINMQNRGDNRLRVALLKPGARIRRTLYRKYKDEPSEGCGEANDNQDSSTGTYSTATSRGRRHSDSSSDDNSNSTMIAPDSNKITISKDKSTLHYDASGSGSDTDSDGNRPDNSQVSSTSEDQRKATPDSGYSQSSSSDEIESSQSSPLTNRKLAITDTENVAKISNQFSRPLEKSFVDGVPIGAARHPRGPNVDSVGFTLQRPTQN